jgi:hypothetical protein
MNIDINNLIELDQAWLGEIMMDCCDYPRPLYLGEINSNNIHEIIDITHNNYLECYDNNNTDEIKITVRLQNKLFFLIFSTESSSNNSVKFIKGGIMPEDFLNKGITGFMLKIQEKII